MSHVLGLYVIRPQTIWIICNLCLTLGLFKGHLAIFILLLYDYGLVTYLLIILYMIHVCEDVHTYRDIYHMDHIVINS